MDMPAGSGDSASRVGGISRIAVTAPLRSWLESNAATLGFTLAVLLVISRRPDAVIHAQFWAEDGRVTFADVYDRGFLRTLIVPQSGYYQALPVLAAGLARPLPLAWAPLAMNLLAIGIRALPVALLLGERARAISTDLRPRVLLAFLYIALPGLPDADANIDNALWYLAVAAVIVLMLAPARRRRDRVIDNLILLGCATTGVFAIALAPLTLIYRRFRSERVPRASVAILVGGGVLQICSLLVLQYHLPAGFNSHARISVPLEGSVPLLFKIVGARVALPTLLGNSLTFSEPAILLAGIITVLLAALAFRHGTLELRLFVAFAVVLFAMALARPQDASWPELTGTSSGRYFIIPGLAVAAGVVWAACQRRRSLCRAAALGVLLVTVCACIPEEWNYPAYESTGFPAKARAFERSPAGTRMIFSLNPPPWTMTLVKR